MTTSRYLRIREHQSLLKDTHSGAIVNDDGTALANYRILKAEQERKWLEQLRQQEQINRLEVEVKDLKLDITDIKKLLIQTLEKMNGTNSGS